MIKLYPIYSDSFILSKREVNNKDMQDLVKRFEQYILLKEKINNLVDKKIDDLDSENHGFNFSSFRLKRFLEFADDKLEKDSMSLHELLEMAINIGRYDMADQVKCMIFDFEQREE